MWSQERGIFDSIMVSISACHAEDQGSIPCRRGKAYFFESFTAHVCASCSINSLNSNLICSGVLFYCVWERGVELWLCRSWTCADWSLLSKQLSCYIVDSNYKTPILPFFCRNLQFWPFDYKHHIIAGTISVDIAFRHCQIWPLHLSTFLITAASVL